MNNLKKRIIRLWIVWLVVGLWVFWWIQYSLYQSRATASQIVSRSVDEPTSSTAEYLKEQQVMIDGQDSILEAVGEMNTQTLLAQWSFNRLDKIHRAEWTLEVVWDENEVFLKFSSDFRAANGPDLYVVLTLWNSYDEQTSLNLWPLVAIEWQQVYKITRDEREQYKNWSLLIWCRAFDVDFSVAEFIN